MSKSLLREFVRQSLRSPNRLNMQNEDSRPTATRPTPTTTKRNPVKPPTIPDGSKEIIEKYNNAVFDLQKNSDTLLRRATDIYQNPQMLTKNSVDSAGKSSNMRREIEDILINALEVDSMLADMGNANQVPAATAYVIMVMEDTWDSLFSILFAHLLPAVTNIAMWIVTSVGGGAWGMAKQLNPFGEGYDKKPQANRAMSLLELLNESDPSTEINSKPIIKPLSRAPSTSTPPRVGQQAPTARPPARPPTFDIRSFDPSAERPPTPPRSPPPTPRPTPPPTATPRPTPPPTATPSPTPPPPAAAAGAAEAGAAAGAARGVFARTLGGIGTGVGKAIARFTGQQAVTALEATAAADVGAAIGEFFTIAILIITIIMLGTLGIYSVLGFIDMLFGSDSYWQFWSYAGVELDEDSEIASSAEEVTSIITRAREEAAANMKNFAKEYFYDQAGDGDGEQKMNALANAVKNQEKATNIVELSNDLLAHLKKRKTG